MNTIKISAVLTAALLTGALSATAFAAETLTTTTGSITFRKAIDVTNAAGAGGITGTIAFDVTAADESDLPDDGEKNYVGSVDQLDGSDIIATFAADDSGIANKESDVSVGFDTSKFEAPGVYYYHLTERDPGIHGLTATTATYLLKVRVVNDNTSDPDGTTFKIDYATLTSLDDNTKSDLITNTYTTHGLTVTKALAGDWADYTDHFIFTLEITDPDADPGRMASVTVQTTSAAGVTSGAEVKPFTNGKVSFSETIRGGDVIEVTGLPTGAAYTITESGLDAEKYTTAWTLDGETLSTERALPTQTVGAADTALTVTNTRSSIAPPACCWTPPPTARCWRWLRAAGWCSSASAAVRIDVGPCGAAGTPGHTAGQCAGRAADAGAAGLRRVRALAGRRAAPRGVCGRGAFAV